MNKHKKKAEELLGATLYLGIAIGVLLSAVFSVLVKAFS